MKAALTFAAFFAGAIALSLIGIGLGQASYRIGKWMDKRGWSGAFVQTLPIMFLIALLFAACGTWIVMKAQK